MDNTLGYAGTVNLGVVCRENAPRYPNTNPRFVGHTRVYVVHTRVSYPGTFRAYTVEVPL